MATALNVTEGILILQKYCLDDPHNVLAANEVIYAGPWDGDVVSEQDKLKLEELGWFIEDESGHWGIFV